MLRWIALSIACVLPIAPALAAEHIGERGGWDIFRDDDSCGMHMEFEGPGETQVTLIKFDDNRIGMSVTNSEWSAKKDVEYDLTFAVNGFEFSGAKSSGTQDSYRHGFVSFFGPNFEPEFVKGRRLDIYLADKQVDQLSLVGSGAAMAAVNTCLAGVRAKKAAIAREEARWQHLPKDPFAGAPMPEPAPETRSVPVPIGSAITRMTENYPSSALREGRSGNVEFRATVGTGGRVSKCEIVKTSGSADLDLATCDGLTRYGRFKPATNEKGEPVEGTYAQTMRWSIN